MKIPISLFLLFLVLSASSSLTAHASSCSNSTIRGTYSFTVQGQILPPVVTSPALVDGIAKTTFDGNGNLRQVDAVAVDGNVPAGWRPGKGTYSINPNCTGTMTIVNQNMPPLHLQIVVAQSGKTIHTVVIDQGFAVTSDADRIQASK
jgi:microcystin-dependent protein